MTAQDPHNLLPARSAGLGGCAHGFFGRSGGVSRGIYRGLNCGFGSDDDPEAVAVNRARAAAFLGRPDTPVATPHQIHGIDVVKVETVWGPRAGPRADAVITDRPGVILGILSADCAPILYADDSARVIGAAHAGWRGALAGVAEATVEAMERLGARRERLTAVIGPCIGKTAYEVGMDFYDTFTRADDRAEDYFAPGITPDRRMFDLPGYVSARLGRAGVGRIEALGLCTYSDPDRFFSYRRTTHRGEADYGRDLSAIVLDD